MDEKSFNIFKIEYSWYEGEHSEIYLGKTVDIKSFEVDLIKAREFAKSLIGKKSYSVECLPEFYQQIIDFLINKLKYIECSLNEELSYDIDDDFSKNIIVTKIEESVKKTELD